MIKWNKTDYLQLGKAVSNFNKKIKELEKIENLIVPDLVDYKELKESIKTRHELKRELNRLRRINKKGVLEIKEYGENLITSYQLNEIRINKSVLTRKLKSQAEFGMNTINYNNNLAVIEKYTKSVLTKKEIQQLENKVSPIQNRKKAENFKTQYLSSIKNNFGVISGVEGLISRLNKIDAEEFIRLIKNDLFLYDFTGFYDFRGNENVFDKLVENWENLLEEDIFESLYSNYLESDYESRE